MQESGKVLEIEKVSIGYKTRKGFIEAVRDVSFDVKRGETIGLVGESGCGKSTVAFGIVNFLGPNGKIMEGSIRFEGNELTNRSKAELKHLRGNKLSMVFQDPMQALNPSIKIGEQLIEVLTCHNDISKSSAFEKSVNMLKKVYMPDPEVMMKRYPHQISGGQQQRIVIAMAALNSPALLIMDEPTTALDVTVEAAVIDLIEDLKKDLFTANIFITHNLGIVSRICDNLCVMYAGQIVEKGTVKSIFENPGHPYTRGLLGCVPRLGESKLDSLLKPIRGRVPAPKDRPKNACIFAPRCNYVRDICKNSLPQMTKVSDGHFVRCLYAGEIDSIQRTVKKRELPENGFSEDINKKEELLTADNIKIYYPYESHSIINILGLGEKKYVKAVDDVNIRVSKGRTLGVVGESGCGKSTLVKGLIGLEPLTDGDIQFMGLEIDGPAAGRKKDLIREMQMVFQNPDSTLNPSYTIGSQIARPIRKFKTVHKNKVKEEVIRLLKAVKLGAQYYGRLPRQLSGGEKQRVGIARALASRPDLIMCDEPVSALDVSVQASVMNLLLEIQQTFGSSMIFIAHDLSVVRFFSDDIAVMYLGQIVEIGPAESIYEPPYHPYTEALLSAVPIPDPNAKQTEIRLDGNVPSALNPPKGCRFHTRCPRRKEMLPNNGEICCKEKPPWRQGAAKGHRILCHIPLEALQEIEPAVNINSN